MGFPPAGGWGTLKSIMRPTPNPTAKGKIINNGNWMKETKITPTNEVSKWPKKIFFGCAKGLSG